MEEGAGQLMSSLKFSRFLGEGSFGKVYLYTHKFSDKQYAVKRMHITKATKKLAKRAIDMCQRCYHPNILNFYGHVFDAEYAYLVFEYMPGSDLKNSVIRKHLAVPPPVLVKWLRQLVSVLAFLRKKGMLHRDIKPANILLTHEDPLLSDVKLSDFDTCRNVLMKNDPLTRAVGTELYMAPDVRNSSSYTNAVDVWSLGCMAFELVTFKVPFSLTTVPRDEQQQAGPIFPQHPPVPDLIKHFIRYCLVYDSERRPTAQDLQSHPLLSPAKPLPDLPQPPNEGLANLPEQYEEPSNPVVDEDEQETGYGQRGPLDGLQAAKEKTSLPVDVEELRDNIQTIFEKQMECIAIFAKITSPAEAKRACNDVRKSLILTQDLLQDSIRCRQTRHEETQLLEELTNTLDEKQQELTHFSNDLLSRMR